MLHLLKKIWNIIVDDGAGDHRVNQTAASGQQGAEHVQREQFQMRPVVGNETFEHFFRLLYCLMETIILVSWRKSKKGITSRICAFP